MAAVGVDGELCLAGDLDLLERDRERVAQGEIGKARVHGAGEEELREHSGGFLRGAVERR